MSETSTILQKMTKKTGENKKKPQCRLLKRIRKHYRQRLNKKVFDLTELTLQKMNEIKPTETNLREYLLRMNVIQRLDNYSERHGLIAPEELQ